MLLLSALQQFDIDPATFFVLLATAGLTLFFVLAALTTPLLGAVTESLYVLKHKSFYDKCALQITQAAFGMGVFIFFTLGAGVIYYIALLQPEMPAAHGSVPGHSAGMFAQLQERFGPLLFFVPPLKGLLLLCVYWSTWSVLKKRRVLHLLLGWSAALSMLGALCFGLYFFSPPAMPLVYLGLFWLGLVCTGLAAGAGLSQLWLFMRRFKADYGRDYYAFAMRYSARVALAFTLAACALLLLLRHSIPAQLTRPPDIGGIAVTAIAVGLPLCCCLLWLGIAKSKNPIRHKPSAFFACVFLFMALCAQLLMLLHNLPLDLKPVGA